MSESSGMHPDRLLFEGCAHHCVVITHAKLVNNELRVRGYVYGRDFPEVAHTMQGTAASEMGMGMSLELAEAHVEDMRAKVWTLTQAIFSGAAILLRTKAAYEGTSFQLFLDKKRGISEGAWLEQGGLAAATGVLRQSIRYCADGHRPSATANRDGECGWVYRHARYMPKCDSRITLKITNVRVEQVQNISEDDALAEGCESWTMTAKDIADMQLGDCSPDDKERARLIGPGTMPARGEFHMLWNSIHGDGAWERNDWVRAITFKRVQS